jgi:hypothetical protein
MTYHCPSGISAVLAHAFSHVGPFLFPGAPLTGLLLWHFQFNTLIWQPESTACRHPRPSPGGSL